MANLKDTAVDGQISVSDPPSAPEHVVRNDDVRLEGPAYWRSPVDTFNNLPLGAPPGGDPINALRVAADTGLIWRHVAAVGTVAQQWAQPPGAGGGVQNTVYIGDSARLVAIAGGVKLEVKNSAGDWIKQAEWAEA
jgi:hypothetical protein